MEGILAYNGIEGSNPDDFYKVWFRNPEASYYLNDRTTWASRPENFINVKEFSVGGPKCLIKR